MEIRYVLSCLWCSSEKQSRQQLLQLSTRTTLECMHEHIHSHEYMSSHGHRGIQWNMDFFQYKLTQQILPMNHFIYSTLELAYYTCTRLLKASCFDQSHENVESLAKKRNELFDLEHASMTGKSILKTKHRLMINGSPHQRPPPFYSDPYNKYQHGHLQHAHAMNHLIFWSLYNI